MFGRKNSKRYFLVFFLVFSLVFSPINFAFFTNISSAKADDLMIETDTEWSGTQTISGYASIAFDATLTIKKGAVIEFDGQATLEVAGNLIVEGTPNEPVVFRKKNNTNPDDFYTVFTGSTGNIHARNIDVSGGGSASEAFLVKKNRERSFFQHANAEWMYSGAFGAQGGGRVDIEGANFHNNALAVYTDQDSYDTTKVWRSKFSGNEIDFVNIGNNTSIKPDIRYNWWGGENGPENCVLECGEYFPRPYQKIIGEANFSDWATKANFKDPIIVIPGIMGSWRMTRKSDLELDPVFGTYDELLETLDKNGYTLEKDLFPFPYEWHNSNVESAKRLKTRIDGIKTQAKWPKVDIVAHSMGGLVAREYISTLNGGSNIDQLITLGTPHNGAPKSYLMWEGGKFVSPSRFNVTDFFANIIFQQEAEENGYENIFDYVRKAPILSVKELLPVYSYLRDKETGTLRTYPDVYPVNAFLQNLKTPTNLNKLSPILFTNIIGKTDENDTIKNIRVDGASVALLSDPEAIVLWGHGKPDGYDDLIGDKGLELGVGDGTVPLESAQGIIADETIELSSSHGDLPTDAAKTVFKTLTGLDVTPHTPLAPVTSILLFMPFSPIDIQIISPSGKKVGKNFATGGIYDQIPGAYYTGYDTQNEFITVPNPEDGEYTILTQGTGDGDYRVEAVKITEETTPSDDVKESLVTFTGTATPDVMEEKKIELLADDTVISKEERDIAAPAVTIVSPENKSYPSSEQVPVTYTAADDVSPEEKITKEIRLDGAVFDQMIIDLSLQTLGTHTLSVQATDEAGNTATETVTFQNTASFASLNKNILHYSTLGLIKKKEDARHIQASLKYLEQLTKLIVRIERMQYFPAQGKERLIKNFKREIEKRKGELFKYMEKRVRKGIIDTEARDRIVEGVEMLVQ